MISNAVERGSLVAMRTDRPDSTRRRPPRLVPHSRSRKDTLAVAPHRKRPEQSDALPSVSRSDVARFGSIFIEPDEVAEGDGIGDVVGFSERIQDRKSTRLNSSHRCISY